MFYPKLLKIKKELNFAEDLIDEFDKWLAFLPDSENNVITVGKVSTKFNIDYTIAEGLLDKLCNEGILEERFIILCPKCERPIRSATKQSLLDVANDVKYCYKCNTEIKITMEDIIFSYKLVEKPNITETELKKYTSKVLGIDDSLSKAERLNKLLKEGKKDLNDFFTFPLKHKYQK
ncbi:hypothetical protein [Clostridium tyrobutyricum]|uniref:hypothetical protein n=1 Tax=Clostridium tyrobutyricum TaxID=1519 RepID=UPI00189E5303|nr:hypothetical protein [Clostridium tyrobutyricum]